MIIKNKINDLQFMFKLCETLTNIEELKYLNVNNCTNFSGMFYYCSS